MKQVKYIIMIGCLLLLSGCGLTGNSTQINVISREEGSGTRSAFVEILGIEDENGDDITTVRAVVQNSTNGVMQLVAGDPNAIGYISLGSLNESIASVTVDGVSISSENILNGSYPIARPFNFAWKEGALSLQAEDFLTFVHSQQGQDIVASLGFVQVNSTEDGELASYDTNEELTGTIEIVGSTSVAPVAEALAEAYRLVQPSVRINISANGSSAGMEAAMNSVADFGMASRALSDSEAAILQYEPVAMDGIAVIVNLDNEINALTSDQIREIFQGDISEWTQVVE